jgi:Tfp pilus assembly protein PilX
MSVDGWQEYWALLLGVVVAVCIALVALAHWFKGTARSRLRRSRKELLAKRSAFSKAESVVAAAERKARKLHERAERTKPRHLHEADEALADARALARIAHDQVLIAENHLRRIIVEEYPPARQAQLRVKYGVQEVPDKRPFTF